MTNRQPFLLPLAIALLAASAVALLVSRLHTNINYLPFFVWIHVAIMALGFYEILRARKLKRLGPFKALRSVTHFPRWLLVLAVPVVLLLIPIASHPIFDLSTLSDGTPVHHKSWSERQGKYYLQLNEQPPIEISSEQYLELERQLFELFASGWLLFAYFELAICLYITKRERECEIVG